MATLSYGFIGQSNPTIEGGKGAHIIQVANGDWYMIAIGYTVGAGITGGGSLRWRKSTDQGLHWSSATIIVTVNSQPFSDNAELNVWYDRWTPGGTGDLIHIAFIDEPTDDVRYWNFDVSSDTLSSSTVVFTGVSASTGTNAQLAITKLLSGDVAIVFDLDGGTEIGHYVAASPYTSWTSKADPNEGADWYFALPGDYTDTADYDLYYLDRSADEWSRKTYDASGDSWSETVLIAGTGVIESATIFPQTAGTIDSSGNHYVFAWTQYDNAAADLVGFKWDGSTATSTALANVVTNSDDCAGVAVMRAGSSLYVFYLGKSDGSQTAGDNVGVYYKVSADDGATWGSEQTLFNTFTDDFRYIACNLVQAATTYLPVCWMNDDTDELMTTMYIPEAGGSGGGGHIIGGGF